MLLQLMQNDFTKVITFNIKSNSHYYMKVLDATFYEIYYIRE